MTQFFVTLPSDSSMSAFPDNTVAHYITKLSQPIRLDGEYEFAITEFLYPHSYHNIDNDDNEMYVMFVKRHDDNQVSQLGYYRVESGYYASESDFVVSFTNSINEVMKKAYPVREITVSLTFNQFTRKLALEIKSDRDITMYMSAKFRSRFGFTNVGSYDSNKVHEAPDIFDVHAGNRLMYIYCDVASYNLVGDTHAPLLRVCNVTGSFGEMQRTTYSHPYYIGVTRSEFDTIEININNELGQPMPFLFGKALVTLHFRRKNLFS
jgi:hypothetical protein